MDREPLEHATGNGMAFGEVSEDECDIQEPSSPHVSSSTLGKLRSMLCPQVGGVQTHELESLVEGGGTDSLADERRRPKHRKTRNYIKAGVAIVIVSLIVYTIIAISILYTAGKKIKVDYRGGLKLDLTCDSDQQILALIEFTNIPSLGLAVDEPKLKFNDWGVLVPNSSIEVRNGTFGVSGIMTVPNEGSLSTFLTHYIGWRLNNTDIQPTIDVGISGMLVTSLFPFRIPFSVSNLVAAPRTDTSFVPTSLDAVQDDLNININMNCTSDGLHAWHHAFDLGFVSPDLQIEATTGYYENSAQQTLVVQNIENGTGFGLANALNTLATPTILPSEVINITGLPGPCLANRIMSKVDIRVRYEFIKAALQKQLNSSTPDESSMTVSMVKTTIRNSRPTGIDLDVTLETEYMMPVRVSGLGSSEFRSSDGSVSKMTILKNISNSEIGVGIDFNSEIFSTNIATPFFNTLSIPPIDGGLCLLGENTTWMGTFINGLHDDHRCITNFTSISVSPGFSLWQALLHPQRYIPLMRTNALLSLTDRHIDFVGSNFANYKTVQMLVPGSAIQIYPLEIKDALPNIEIFGDKKISAVTTGELFDSRVESFLDDVMLYVDVNFTKLNGFGKILVGGGGVSNVTIFVSNWEIDVPMHIEQWKGLFSLEKTDEGDEQIIAENPFPVSFYLEGGQELVLDDFLYGMLPNEGIDIPMHTQNDNIDGSFNITAVVIPFTSLNNTIPSEQTKVTLSCRKYHSKPSDSSSICPDDPDRKCTEDGVDEICFFKQSDACELDISSPILIYDVCPQECVWCQLSSDTKNGVSVRLP